MPVRRRTVNQLLHEHARERQTLLQVIREQNDRLMHLAGRSWTLPPRDTTAKEDEIDPQVAAYEAELQEL